MIVDDLDVCRVAVVPANAHAPLIVDPDRVLSGAISPECFEPKAWRLEIVKRTDLVEECEPTLRGALECLEPCDSLTLEESLRLLRPEVPDHMSIIVRLTYYVNRMVAGPLLTGSRIVAWSSPIHFHRIDIIDQLLRENVRRRENPYQTRTAARSVKAFDGCIEFVGSRVGRPRRRSRRPAIVPRRD